MAAAGTPKQRSGLRQIHSRILFIFLLVVVGLIGPLSLSCHNSMAILRTVGLASDVPDDLLTTEVIPKQNYENQMSSTRSRVEYATQITSPQSSAERMEKALLSSEKQISFLQSRLDIIEKALGHVSDAKEQQEHAGSQSSSPDHENKTPIVTTTTALRPCRVAVTNSLPYHFETLESIASLFPLDALNFEMTQSVCDEHNIMFDYHVIEQIESDKRVVNVWIDYFKTTLTQTHVNVSSSSGADDKVSRRAFGEVITHNSIGISILEVPLPIVIFPNTYDAVIEASCFCSPIQLNWMKSDSSRSCIFHETCEPMVKDPRAVWLSPHHKKYFIPLVLQGSREQEPPEASAVNQMDIVPHKICVIGEQTRRDWGLLRGYLESPLGMAAIAASRFAIHILGEGALPVELESYRNVTTKPPVDNDSEFAHAVRQCHGLIMLVSKKSQRDYFATSAVADSKQMLTGSIPIVIAYQIPVVIHEELYGLYQEHLQRIPHATHSDSGSSFNVAMNQFLDLLDANETQITSLHPRAERMEKALLSSGKQSRLAKINKDRELVSDTKGQQEHEGSQSRSPDHENKTAIITTTAIRPCRVAVTNSFSFHYETLESIASLFPLDALNFEMTQSVCDEHNILFDYHVVGPGHLRAATKNRGYKRVKVWIDYFRTTLTQTHVNVSSSSGAGEKVSRRTFGEVFTLKRTSKSTLVDNGKTSTGHFSFSNTYDYDAVIEASCHCESGQMNWMKRHSGRSCIFHETCEPMVKDPRAVWLSPHYKKYFIPHVLPGSREQRPPKASAVNQMDTSTVPHKICVLTGSEYGRQKRRDWGLLRGYLESPLGMAAIAASRFTIQILGEGALPVDLESYRNVTTKPPVDNDSEFTHAVSQCHGLIMLISKKSHGDYFPTSAVAGSRQKLAGAIPIVIADQIPVVIHEELYGLYQEHLQHIPHATYSDMDIVSSFKVAMNQFLDLLDANETQITSLHPRAERMDKALLSSGK
jgi:hypothetical protein